MNAQINQKNAARINTIIHASLSHISHRNAFIAWIARRS
ncbi:hypothetical protein MGWOODY_Mmi1157 [hydrothermal vent metagenome]|uniref:Uncharacterized protein n=1 Tax=hydrothermal vent metagenome TaxID=652676 RepID=A0A160VE72_9ZZZZ